MSFSSTPSPFVERVTIRNFKSIAACEVKLGPLAFLVGPNGSGKSNFLDSLNFVTDALRFSLDHAFRDRGGISEVRRLSRGHPNHFGIRLDVRLGDGRYGHYAFYIAARDERSYAVKEEECFLIAPSESDADNAFFRVKTGNVTKCSISSPPAASKDRLYLVNMSGFPEFRSIFDNLSSMGFYNLNPAAIRELQTPDPGERLNSDGSNLASVVDRMESDSPKLVDRIQEYLANVVPGIVSVESTTVGPKLSLEFRQEVAGSEHPWGFPANSMSDGTLRTLGILVALFQHGSENGGAIPLVGIEEPEIALHPAAAGIVTDSLRDASRQKQVIVTSHSPDLLDNEAIDDTAILAVISEKGKSRIGRLDEPGRKTLHDHLYTAGELLRMDQLRPDPNQVDIEVRQRDLFGQRDN